MSSFPLVSVGKARLAALIFFYLEIFHEQLADLYAGYWQSIYAWIHVVHKEGIQEGGRHIYSYLFKIWRGSLTRLQLQQAICEYYLFRK